MDMMILIIVLMALATFLTRRLMLIVPEKYLTLSVKRGLLYVPIGVFAGLIFPTLFLEEGQLVWKMDYLLTAVVCILLMLWKKDFLFSFIGGLLFIVALQFIM
ncbi:AzlD domain-containing protein [Peribacillus sp. NPDC101480]|uniref:AzlD domain-containing protein n=1 Tax=Peribacillus sp. NPDC101480 TaxID=3390620 RepID=UPI003CFF3AF3